MPLKINEMYAFICDEPDGEGIPAVSMGPMMMPLVGADMTRIDSLREHAQLVADQSGRKITLVKFSVREELGTILPQQGMH
jgi:hypothetical protein